MSDDRTHCQVAGEVVLLITCLRGLPFLVPTDTDWQALLKLAEAHGVLLQIHQSFLEKGVAMPGFFVSAVRERRKATETLAAELEKLLEQFAERGIEVLPLKGPVLAEALYSDVTMRSYTDLDLLVRRGDFQRAEALLLDLAFVAPAAADNYRRSFLREGIAVELHFGLGAPRSFPLDSFPLDTDGVWSRSREGEFRGKALRLMSDDDLILFLCLHGLKHGFSRLIWILDVALALRLMRQCSPAQLVRSARRQHLELALLIGCEAVREMLLQPLPQGMDALIAESPELAGKARRSVARLFAEDARVTNPDIRSFYLQTGQSVRQRWHRRLSFFAPTVEDYAWAERHRVYAALAPVLRPFRLLGKHGPTRLWRIVFPPPM